MSQESSLPKAGFMGRLAPAGINILALFLAGPLLADYGLYLFGAREWGPVELAGAILPWIYSPIVLLLPLALWLRRRFLVILAGISALLFALTYGHLFLPALPQQVSEPTFTVMSYNVLFSTTQAESILAEIERQNPDILGLQEMKAPKYERLRASLASKYPYYSAWEGQGLFSRFPINKCRTLMKQGNISGWVYRCQMKIQGRPVTVYTCTPGPRCWCAARFWVCRFSPIWISAIITAIWPSYLATWKPSLAQCL